MYGVGINARTWGGYRRSQGGDRDESKHKSRETHNY
jgi:hypothetical protein